LILLLLSIELISNNLKLPMNSFIAGVGHYVPERVVTNFDLEKLMDTNDAWIRERSGIAERRWIVPGKDTTASMGTEAARVAIARAGITANDIDLIIFATLTPDYFFPGPGVAVQHNLGCHNIGALDIREQCAGFLYGLSVADQFIKSGMYRNILVVGSETHSTMLDLTTRGRGVSVLFGDGAGAAVVQATNSNESCILSTHLHSQGEFADQLITRSPGTHTAQRIYPGIENDTDNIFMFMNGNAVFKHAITRFAEVIQEALDYNNLTKADIDMVVPHQANIRITQYLQKYMDLPQDKVFSNIERYGNTSSATIPICLSELYEQNKLSKGDTLMLAAFGSGFTWASALLKW
jgi:3-oxoacyl-[acyl-carrier-protein] synthase-3